MTSTQPPARRLHSSMAFALLGAALGVAACGGTASPSPAPTSTPSPSPTPANGGTGLDVPLPDGWQEVELTREALQAQIDLLAETNPELVAPLQQLLDAGSFASLSFYALGFDGLEPIGNANVVTFPAPGLNIDAIASVVEGQFEQIGATDIEIASRPLLGTDGLVMDYVLDVGGEGQTATLTGRAFVAIVDGTAYDLTVTCTAADPAPCLADADAMADGMTLGGS
ncbi:MAG: hypothetical protein L0227_05005 [Chloroflexi bacterium]|nr:hypothetical protein [Chloroflexota bacterium]